MFDICAHQIALEKDGTLPAQVKQVDAKPSNTLASTNPASPALKLARQAEFESELFSRMSPHEESLLA